MSFQFPLTAHIFSLEFPCGAVVRSIQSQSHWVDFQENLEAWRAANVHLLIADFRGYGFSTGTSSHYHLLLGFLHEHRLTDQKFNFLDSSLNVKVSIRHSAGMIVIILINTINNNNDNIDNSNSNHNNSSNTACEIILITVKLSCVNNCTSSLYRCHTDYRSA